MTEARGSPVATACGGDCLPCWRRPMIDTGAAIRDWDAESYGYVKPWALDGYNEQTRELSEDIEFFATHAEAVAAIPAFLARNNFSLIGA